MVTLNIHWETFDEKSFSKVKELASTGPVAISLAPWQIPLMPAQQKTWLKNLLQDPDYILGQQGLNHKCKVCEKLNKSNNFKIDIWHENYCLWFGEIPEVQQEKFMKQGKQILEEEFSVSSSFYVPPNHYFSYTTIALASKLGYNFISDRAKIPIKPYKEKGIIVIPESEPEISENTNFYIHADRWRGDLETIIKRKLQPFKKINLQKSQEKEIKKNREIKIKEKISRDFVKGFNISEEIATPLANLLYQAKFADSKMF